MIYEEFVRVSRDPAVELFTVRAAESLGRDPLLVIHGGPDWDHAYLLDPLAKLADRHDVIFPDLRGCGRSTRGLPDDQYTPAAATAEVWSDPALSGPALTRAAAFAGAEADVWRAEALDAYRERLSRVRFSAEWLRPWRAGTLPPARPDRAAGRLAVLGVPILLLHGRRDMTFPAALTERAGS
ncbi:alpha/beta fold hydrolase [Nonomuraea antimicrobica]